MAERAVSHMSYAPQCASGTCAPRAMLPRHNEQNTQQHINKRLPSGDNTAMNAAPIGAERALCALREVPQVYALRACVDAERL